MSETKKEVALANVNPENYFRVANGTVIKGLMDLDSSLESMSEETFKYHVNDYRNDFSTWIRETIKEEKLANDLLLTRDKTKTQVLVLRGIVEITGIKHEQENIL